MKKLLIKLLFVILIESCSGNSNKGPINNSKSALESNSFVDTSPYQFELGESCNDTFKLVSHDWYFFYCFGKFANPNQLEVKFNNIAQIRKELTFVFNDSNNIDTLYRLVVNDGFIKYLFDEGEQKMQLVSVKIATQKLGMTNGIKVGLNRKMFNNILFGQNVPSKIEEYNYLQIETALTGIWITFSFKNKILKTISLDTDYQLDKS